MEEHLWGDLWFIYFNLLVNLSNNVKQMKIFHRVSQVRLRMPSYQSILRKYYINRLWWYVIKLWILRSWRKLHSETNRITVIFQWDLKLRMTNKMNILLYMTKEGSFQVKQLMIPKTRKIRVPDSQN